MVCLRWEWSTNKELSGPVGDNDHSAPRPTPIQKGGREDRQATYYNHTTYRYNPFRHPALYTAISFLCLLLLPFHSWVDPSSEVLERRLNHDITHLSTYTQSESINSFSQMRHASEHSNYVSHIPINTSSPHPSTPQPSFITSFLSAISMGAISAPAFIGKSIASVLPSAITGRLREIDPDTQATTSSSAVAHSLNGEDEEIHRQQQRQAQTTAKKKKRRRRNLFGQLAADDPLIVEEDELFHNKVVSVLILVGILLLILMGGTAIVALDVPSVEPRSGTDASSGTLTSPILSSSSSLSASPVTAATPTTVTQQHDQELMRRRHVEQEHAIEPDHQILPTQSQQTQSLPHQDEHHMDDLEHHHPGMRLEDHTATRITHSPTEPATSPSSPSSLSPTPAEAAGAILLHQPSGDIAPVLKGLPPPSMTPSVPSALLSNPTISPSLAPVSPAPPQRSSISSRRAQRMRLGMATPFAVPIKVDQPIEPSSSSPVLAPTTNPIVTTTDSISARSQTRSIARPSQASRSHTRHMRGQMKGPIKSTTIPAEEIARLHTQQTTQHIHESDDDDYTNPPRPVIDSAWDVAAEIRREARQAQAESIAQQLATSHPTPTPTPTPPTTTKSSPTSTPILSAPLPVTSPSTDDADFDLDLDPDE